MDIELKCGNGKERILIPAETHPPPSKTLLGPLLKGND